MVTVVVLIVIALVAAAVLSIAFRSIERPSHQVLEVFNQIKLAVAKVLLVCPFDNLYIHIVLEIFILMLLSLTSSCNRNSSSGSSKCRSGGNITSKVHVLPFGDSPY